MRSLKPSEKMDAILGYLKDHSNDELSIRAIDGYIKYSKPGALESRDLKRILKILTNDHHIQVITPGLYKVTLEGIIFMENGGYTIQRKENQVRRQYLKFSKKAGNETSSLTLWLIGFLIIFGAYFLFQYGYHHWNWKIPF
ncbi:hypothetical protein [Mucilaginibacter sp.]